MAKLTITFDLDDTLYAERDFVRSGFHAVSVHLEKLKIIESSIFFETAWNLFEKGIRNLIFNQSFELLKIKFSYQQLLELIDVYRSHIPKIIPFPKAELLLTSLMQIGTTLSLISDGPTQTQKNKLLALGLEKYFHHIIFTDSYGPGWNKPNDLAFLEIMKRTQSRSKNCVYVADNPKKDFIGPNKLGWKTIRLCFASGLYYAELPPLGGEPIITVENIDELGNFLLKENYYTK